MLLLGLVVFHWPSCPDLKSEGFGVGRGQSGVQVDKEGVGDAAARSHDRADLFTHVVRQGLHLIIEPVQLQLVRVEMGFSDSWKRQN